jgi:C4-dicarboxylate transporter/malic acid transport protein
MRFIKFPETLRASVTHPTESLFMPSAVVSFGTVLLNICQYGLGSTGPWLNHTVLVLFWMYAALALIASSATYVLIWSTQTFVISQMTPIWIFPAYPLLLVGPFAGFLASTLKDTPQSAFTIVIGGFICQGIGFLVSITIYSAFIYRLMTQKLPKEAIRPGIFVSVGPAAFTCGALINMASAAADAFPPTFANTTGNLAAAITSVVANFAALWLWGLAIWFFIVCVASHTRVFRRHGMEFAMTWFSFVFPNTALITATFAVGGAFACDPLRWVGCALTIIIVPFWAFVFGMMLRAILLKHILWPQKQDDRDEGGFKGPAPRNKPDMTNGLKRERSSPV